MQPLLHIRNLSLSFQTENGPVNALQQVSLSIHRGETVAVVGESGSGKSVTALSVLRLLPESVTRYTEGEIQLFNKDGSFTSLLTAPTEILSAIRGNRIGMIFQEPMTSLNPVITCGRQVAETICRHKKISMAKALEQTAGWFAQVDLPEPKKLLHKYPHQLSGGQKQRVMIALAMCCRPDVLICDEPTTALDVTVQKNIIGLIKKLQQTHQMGVLFISHDLGLVAEIAHTIVVMYKGKIVEAGSAKKLLQEPEHPYTRALLACRPALHPKGQRLPVVADFMPEAGDTPKPATQVIQTPLPPPDYTRDTPFIQAEKLTVRFASPGNWLGKSTQMQTAVNAVDINIFRGETLGLVGESGCGKTTLGRALLLLQAIESGKIIFDGTEINNLKGAALKRFRKRAQLVFQDPYSSLNGRLTIGEAITEPMRVHGIGENAAERKKLALQLLDQVQLLPAHYHRYPHEFSGGQRQRIVIARVLALHPEFVICDESVSALDVSVQAQVLNLLNDLKAAFGFTILFISHDLSVIRYISDRIMVMRAGTIVETGNAEALCRNPKQEYTRNLLDAVPGGMVAG